MNEILYYLPVVSALLVPGAIVLAASALFSTHNKRVPKHRRVLRR